MGMITSAIFGASFACAVGVCLAGCHNRASLVPAVTTAPNLPPTTSHSAAGMSQGLVRNLVKPYWEQTAAGWESFFRDQYFGGAFDVEQRDKVLADVGRVIDNLSQRGTVQILILEHVGQRGQYGTYERTILATYDEKLPPRTPLSEFGAVQLNEPQWKPIRQYADELLRIGGRSNGWRYMHDGTDALVLTYFDGKQWRTDTWFCISSPDFVSPPAHTESDLPRHVRVYAHLLRYLNGELGREASFQTDSRLTELLSSEGK